MTTDQTQIIAELKPILKKYSPPYEPKKDGEGGCDLYYFGEVEAFGRKYDEMFFAAIQKMKNYVGFYYMPIYANPELAKKLHPDLLKLLKGKSCFHIKKLDENLKKHIAEALKTGHECYKKMGWCKG